MVSWGVVKRSKTLDFDSSTRRFDSYRPCQIIRLIDLPKRFIIISLTERTMYYKDIESNLRAKQEHDKRQRELSAERMKRVALQKKSKK